MNHLPECTRPMSVDLDGNVGYETFGPCICKQLLSAGARGYKSGYDDAYFDGYNDGYDAALASGAAMIVAPESGFDWPPNFNQHGTGENP